MKVISLFDGMGCLGIALKDMGIQFEYYTSEIDKHAMKVSKLNFPDSVQLGDVTKWREWDVPWSQIDLIGAGSPCQGFSFAGKQLAFDDPRSALFFTFVEIFEHCRKHNPNVLFLLENVRMKREHELVISRYMGVAPIEINAALVSAQSRQRLFWTNIYNEPYGLFGDMACMIPQPKDRGILLKDILEEDVDEKYFLSKKMIESISEWNSTDNPLKRILTGYEKTRAATARGMGEIHSDMTLIVAQRGRNAENGKEGFLEEQVLDLENKSTGRMSEAHELIMKSINNEKSTCIDSSYYKGFGIVNGKCRQVVVQLNPSKESHGQQPYQQNRVYSIDGKNPALCSQLITGSNYIVTHNLQPRNGKGIGGKGHLSKTDQKSYCLDTGNAQAVELMIEKSPCLHGFEHGTNGQLNKQLARAGLIRRLTPTECARLQTIPDWYNWGKTSDTQIYKMLGNGWCVEVIKHILSFM